MWTDEIQPTLSLEGKGDDIELAWLYSSRSFCRSSYRPSPTQDDSEFVFTGERSKCGKKAKIWRILIFQNCYVVKIEYFGGIIKGLTKKYH